MVQEQNMRVTTRETDGRTHLTSGDLPARTSENGEMCPGENEEVIRLRGRVVRGSGRASFFTSLGWVKDRCREEFGFTPYPGTLNIKVSPELRRLVRRLRRRSRVVFHPPARSGYYPARACRVLVNGAGGVAVFPASRVNIHDSDTIEIMSDVCLREVLGIGEGDEVSLEVREGSLAQKGRDRH